MTTLPQVPAITPEQAHGGAHDRDGRVGEVLVSAEELQARVRELGEQISRDYAGRPLLLVGVLKGAVFFLSDLMRYIEIPVEVDFMAVASYGSATDSSGVVRILKDLDAAIEDRDVLIVEDIVDSGLTLQYLLRNLGSRDPRTLEVCALLTKPAGARWRCRRATSGSRSTTGSWWATAWTTPSATATCRSWRRWSGRSADPGLRPAFGGGVGCPPSHVCEHRATPDAALDSSRQRPLKVQSPENGHSRGTLGNWRPRRGPAPETQ